MSTSKYIDLEFCLNIDENEYCNAIKRVELIPKNAVSVSPVSGPQVSGPQVSVPQVSGPQVSGPQVSGPQVGVPQVGVPQVGVPQVGEPTVGVPQVGVQQVGVPQVGGPQVGEPTVDDIINLALVSDATVLSQNQLQSREIINLDNFTSIPIGTIIWHGNKDPSSKGFLIRTINTPFKKIVRIQKHRMGESMDITVDGTSSIWRLPPNLIGGKSNELMPLVYQFTHKGGAAVVPPIPEGKQMAFEDAIKYGNGYTSKSLIAYLKGDINHITPGAYADYIEGRENDWSNIVYNILEIINENEETAPQRIHDIRKVNLNLLYNREGGIGPSPTSVLPVDIEPMPVQSGIELINPSIVLQETPIQATTNKSVFSLLGGGKKIMPLVYQL